MTRLRRLVNEAKVAMQKRGHNPGSVQYALIEDHAGQPIGARIRCTGCDLAGFVTVWPKANEIDIGGPAIGLNCTFLSGSVSTNTIVPLHLIIAFLPTAEVLFTGKDDRNELFRIRERVERGYPKMCGDDFEDIINEDLDFLIDGLSTCAPVGMYFGAHPNDGADFGFWQIPS